MTEIKSNIYVDISESLILGMAERVVKKTLKDYGEIEDIIEKEIIKKGLNYIDKSIANGSFLQSVAKNVTKTINDNDVIKLIDINKLHNDIANKVSDKLVNQMKNK